MYIFGSWSLETTPKKLTFTLFFIAKSLGVKKFPFVIEGVHIDIYKQYVENHGVGKPKDFDHFHNFLKYITENINRD